MANVKISELPAVSSVSNTDIFPVVASSVTSKLNLRNLANSLPQVTSSLSASFALNATTSSHAIFAISSSYSLSSSLASLSTTASFTVSSSVAVTSSFALTASYVSSVGSTFPYTGSAEITGSLKVTGSISTSTNTYANTATYARSFQPYNGQYGKIPLDPINPSVTASAAISWWSSNQNAGVASFGPGAIDVVYYADQNLGQIGLLDQNTFNNWAGSLKFIRDNSLTDINSGKLPYNVLVTNNATLIDVDASISTLTSNGRVHVLGVTGSFLARDGVTLGSNIGNLHYVSGSTSITGSVRVTGSLSVGGLSSSQTSALFNNGHIVLSQVSASLNFADDTAAAAGGVPLGGLYRNGNFVLIRIL